MKNVLFSKSILYTMLAVSLWRCDSGPGEAARCDNDTIIYDRYTNHGLGFSIRIPLHWDTVSSSEKKGWEDLGRSIMDSSRPVVPVHDLVTLQHKRENSSSLFKISCVAQDEFPHLKNVHEYTVYNQKLLDESLARIGAATHSSVEERKIEGKKFEFLRMYLYTRFSTIYRMEFMNLYHKGNIITLAFSYDNELDSLECHAALQSLKFLQ